MPTTARPSGRVFSCQTQDQPTGSATGSCTAFPYVLRRAAGPDRRFVWVWCACDPGIDLKHLIL